MFADLSDCFLLATQLQGADLDYTDLRGARLPMTNLYRADLAHAKLDGARFENVDLRGALNLMIDQLKVAEIDEFTTLPDYIDAAALAAALKPKPPAA